MIAPLLVALCSSPRARAADPTPLKDVNPASSRPDDPRAKELPRSSRRPETADAGGQPPRVAGVPPRSPPRAMGAFPESPAFTPPASRSAHFPPPPKDVRIKDQNNPHLDGDGLHQSRTSSTSPAPAVGQRDLYLPREAAGEDGGRPHLAQTTTLRRARELQGHGHEWHGRRRGAGAGPPRPRRTPASNDSSQKDYPKPFRVSPAGLLLPPTTRTCNSR